MCGKFGYKVSTKHVGMQRNTVAKFGVKHTAKMSKINNAHFLTILKVVVG